MTKPIIQIKNLTKRFGTDESSITALENIDLEINTGDIFGVIGLSGAGKSTLIRCMNLLERPTSGQVIFDGADLTEMKPKQLRSCRRSIGMIFQGFNLLMQRTALENICFPLELEGVKKQAAKARAEELLRLVGLSDRADAYPSQLSGGQKQRIAIARALANSPKVLLCDEATSALDPNTTRSILELLQQINRELGVTIVIITHEMRVIEQICTRVAVLDTQRIVEMGPVEKVFSNPQSKMAKELILPELHVEDRTQGLVSDHMLRIVFRGNSAYEPLISQLSTDCGVGVSILDADLRTIEGKTYGSMLVELPHDPKKADIIRAYLSRKDGVEIREVKDND